MLSADDVPLKNTVSCWSMNVDVAPREDAGGDQYRVHVERRSFAEQEPHRRSDHGRYDVHYRLVAGQESRNGACGGHDIHESSAKIHMNFYI